MNRKLRTLGLSLCLLASSVAMADDAVWGALLGGGAGAAIGGSVSGRNGAIVGGALGAAAGAVIASGNNHRQVEYAPAPVYHSRPVYYSAQPVYYAQPVRVTTPTVYYVVSERDRRHGHHHRKDWRPQDNRWHGYR
jgi:hypothetical protein